MKYDHKEIERKWREKWEESGIYKTPEIISGDEKAYILDMYPYPSGSGLHVGHPRGYLATDVVARFSRMNGKKVLHPMGFDSFGLPAENYAIKTGTPPEESTNRAIDYFKKQISGLGMSYDWDKEIMSHDPEYMKWTQWLFLKMYEKGIAYQKEAPVNWCPSCNTVLANEQVESDGTCERCGTEVVQKNLKQWFFKITDYAERLIDDLEKIDWPNSTKLGQINWIGRSKGARIKFNTRASKYLHNNEDIYFNPETDFELATSDWSSRNYKAMGLVVVRNQEGKILALKRAEKDHMGTWDLAGGSIKTEDLVDGVLRELVEETGLNPSAEELNFLLSYEGYNPEFDKNYKYFVFEYRLKETDSVEISDEHSEYNFFSIDEAFQNLYWYGHKMAFSISGQDLEVFTTRPDTIYGATFMVLAPEHQLVQEYLAAGLVENKEEVEDYIQAASKKTELERQQQKEKTGVKLDGVVAVNPVNGEDLPIFIADYVLANYGTGAIMAVPAHDERDLEFARKYQIDIKTVVRPEVEKDADLSAGSTIIVLPNSVLDKELSLEEEISKIDIAGGVAVPRIIKGDDFSAIWTDSDDYTLGQVYKLLANFKSIDAEILMISKDGDIAISKLKDLALAIEDRNEEGYFTQITLLELMSSKYWKILSSLNLLDEVVTTNYGVAVNSPKINYLRTEKAIDVMIDQLEELGVGKAEVNYKLRDWLISRQRYWGCPIPIVYDPEGNAHPVKEEHLPLRLPTDVDYSPKGTSPVGSSESYRELAEDLYGKGWRFETDTLDTFMDSSWYFFRFTDVNNKSEFASKEQIHAWMPVDLYVGGAEHTVLHLMYARFFTKFLFDEGYIDFDEPFMKLRHQGTVLAEDGRKMSKRWGNTLDPSEEVEKYGADTLRVYEMFMGPFEGTMPWNTETEVGVYRFLQRVWDMKNKIDSELMEMPYPDRIEIDSLIKKVGEDISNMRFNTAIAQMMAFVNTLQKEERISVDIWQKFLIILAPFAPFITEELWANLGHKESIHIQSWPEYDQSVIDSMTIEMAVQFKGKTRGTIEVERDISQQDVEEIVKLDEKLKKYLEDKEIIKVIYVPNKIINFILK